MSYIGRGIDQIDNVSTLDNLTFSGSTPTFNLTQNSVAFVPVSADALQIQIDGVIQSGNYTVSGSTVTFDFTPSSSSVCNGIKHFGVGVLTTPSDGSVNMAQLGASGTKSSSTFLAGDNTFKTVSGTTINNNADDRIITGSGTANTLNGESNLTLSSGGALLHTGTGSEPQTSGSSQTYVNRQQVNHNGVIDTGINGSSPFHAWIQYHDKTDLSVNYNLMIQPNGGKVYMGATSSSGYNGAVWQDPDGISIHRANSTGGNGALLIYSDDGGAKTNKGYWKNNGGIVNYQSNDGDLSDERLKKDITDAPSSWDTIKNLKVRNYKYKTDDDSAKTHIGLIAQETEAVDSSLVNTTDGMYGFEEEQKDEKYKQIYNKDLYFKMLKALQEAQTKIETLETENTDIKARLTALENK